MKIAKHISIICFAAITIMVVFGVEVPVLYYSLMGTLLAYSMGKKLVYRKKNDNNTRGVY